jgi:hypothetical protein
MYITICIFIILVSVLLLAYLLVKKTERFNGEYELKSHTSDLTDLKLSGGKVYVGENIPNDGDIMANDTIFIENGTDFDGTTLTLDIIKSIKYIPYNFKDKMCIGNSCITKNNIKMLKGKSGFNINTFTSPNPITFFTGVNFTGDSWTYKTDRDVPDASRKGNGIKSFKIHVSDYAFTAYEDFDYGGARYKFEDESNGNVTNIFPDGFKSIKPVEKKNIIKKECLSQVMHDENKIYRPVSCNKATDVYYLYRDDLFNDHTHAPSQEEIHFHDHSDEEPSHY